MKKLALLTAAAALLAVPAFAYGLGGEGGHGPKGPMTRAELQKQLGERFAGIDANKDGAITQAEFDAHHQAMRQQWMKKRAERMDAHFAEMDADKNGQISKAEFDAFHAKRAEDRAGHRHERMGGTGMGVSGMGGGKMHGHGYSHEAMMGGMFTRADANKDGKVTLSEFTAMPLAMFDKADTNKDGTVTPEERRAVRGKMREEWKEKAGTAKNPS